MSNLLEKRKRKTKTKVNLVCEVMLLAFPWTWQSISRGSLKILGFWGYPKKRKGFCCCCCFAQTDPADFINGFRKVWWTAVMAFRFSLTFLADRMLWNLALLKLVQLRGWIRVLQSGPLKPNKWFGLLWVYNSASCLAYTCGTLYTHLMGIKKFWRKV